MPRKEKTSGKKIIRIQVDRDAASPGEHTHRNKKE